MITTPIATYLLYFFLSDPTSYLCTFEDRTKTCTDEFTPVCALYTDSDCSSASGFCQKQSDSCTACFDPFVIGYIPGECLLMSTQICMPERTALCAIEDMVCVYSEMGGSVSQALDDFCSACTSRAAAFNTFGDCSDLNSLTICKHDTEVALDCMQENQDSYPVCAYYTGGDCQDHLCRRTKTNSCLACSDVNVLFYLGGSCGPEDLIIDHMLEDNDTQPIESSESEEASKPEDSSEFVKTEESAEIAKVEVSVEIAITEESVEIVKSEESGESAVSEESAIFANFEESTEFGEAEEAFESQETPVEVLEWEWML